MTSILYLHRMSATKLRCYKKYIYTLKLNNKVLIIMMCLSVSNLLLPGLISSTYAKGSKFLFSYNYVLNNTQCTVLLWNVEEYIISIVQCNQLGSTLLLPFALKLLYPVQCVLWLQCILLLRTVSLEKFVSLPLKWWISPCVFLFRMINPEKGPLLFDCERLTVKSDIYHWCFGLLRNC